MTWNYRVFREEDGGYVIREVFYDDDDSSIEACTEKAVEPFGESLEELAQDIEWFKEALTMPVLTQADVPCASTKKPKHVDDRDGNITREQLMVELDLE